MRGHGDAAANESAIGGGRWNRRLVSAVSAACACVKVLTAYGLWEDESLELSCQKRYFLDL